MVFIDETWAKTNMSRTRGRALFGQRLVEAVPHGHWATTTILMGLRSNGVVAPMVIDGPINGEIFLDKIDTGECINFIKHCGYRIRSLAATTTKALL